MDPLPQYVITDVFLHTPRSLLPIFVTICIPLQRDSFPKNILHLQVREVRDKHCQKSVPVKKAEVEAVTPKDLTVRIIKNGTRGLFPKETFYSPNAL